MATSRSSSHTSHLDDASVLSDPSHFEDISLDDGSSSLAARRGPARDPNLRLTIPKSHTSPYPSDAPTARSAASTRTLTHQGDVPQKSLPQRDPSRSRGARSPRRPNSRPVSPNGVADAPRSPGPPQRPPIRSSTSSLYPESLRSPSPNFLGPQSARPMLGPRRRSWQSNRDRKSIADLESQYDDEEEDDDIPDGLILDNVPISPRPSRDRPKSQPQSPLLLPQNPPPKGRSVGNGTPPIATAQGSLRSPTWKSDTALSDSASGGECAFPSAKGRAKSWNIAMASLSPEMKALTEKLEEHSDTVDEPPRPTPDKRPATWGASRQVYDPSGWEPQLKKRSQLLELPPLRTNVMIDPLPVSKEKEAVLSRTRPSWLPPKDPAEERRHLKQYQKMMAQSAEAERRREAARSASNSRRDVKADALMRLWEDDILPRWNEALRERRTRDHWWRGVAPRSRGAVWARAIGNDLGLTDKSYAAALGRAREAEARVREGKGDAEDGRRAEWFASIRRDVGERTWPDLRIFQVGGPLHESLVDVLSAYAMYRGDIGYVSGCNSIAALLLLNLPDATQTFISLSNLLNRPIPLSFHASDRGAKASAYNLVLRNLADEHPLLHAHLTSALLKDPEPGAYLGPVFASLFTSSLAVDEAARLWDVYVFEGDAVLIRAATALLLEEEGPIMAAKSSAEVREILTGAKDGRRGRAVAEVGAEDRWMEAVRAVGEG